MSLKPDSGRSGRSRSKSPGPSGRSRSRSNVRASDSGKDSRYGLVSSAEGPSGASGGYGAASPAYEVRSPTQATPGLSSFAPQSTPQYATPSSLLGGGPQQNTETRGSSPGSGPGNSNSIAGYAPQGQQNPYGYTTSPPGANQGPGGNIQYSQPLQPQYSQTQPFNYTASPVGSAPPQQPTRAPGQYNQQGGGFQYASIPDHIQYTSRPQGSQGEAPPQQQHQTGAPMQPPMQPPLQNQYTPSSHQQPPGPYQQPLSQPSSYQQPLSQPDPLAYGGQHANIKEITPGGGSMKPPPSPNMRPHGASMSGGRLDLGTLSPNTLSPGGLAPRMDRLSVSGNRPDMNQIMGGGLPPGSPLLEAYKGTWQSLSPMPSPMMLPNDDVDDLPPLEGLSSREERKREKRNRIRDDVSPGPRSSRKEKEREKEKRAKFYDAEEDALALVDALGHRTPDTRVIANIIPALSHDQLMELRSEYKRHCKVQGRGINIAKHLKMKTTGNFGKICYVTALGRWESEGYWANYWYQSQGAKRELLIEALMGRSNYEIEEIKDSFRDKRYSDNLIKCMDKELKADKFRTAVLMALEEKRQDERDVYPEEYRNRDVHTLHNAVKSREGGESTMLQIVITRSDAHLRDILKRYERVFQSNFAKDALRKSNNLVGEVIAHILNGIINKPARDAMLLYHALTDLMDTPAPTSSGRSSSDKVSSAKHERQQRYELLMSRLVRLHWDKIHLMRVKNEYKDKYRRYLEEDIEDATRGDFQEFCLALCEVQR